MAYLDSLLGSGSDPTTISSVKNPALASANNANLTNYNALVSKQQPALSDYISSYLANKPTAAKNSAQEIGAVNNFYNGNAAADLAGMRASRTTALMDSAKRAGDYALAAQNRSRVGGDGGTGSYDKQLATKNLTDIFTQSTLDNANQERGDWNYLTGQQLNLAGKRTQMASDMAAYGLVPLQTEANMLNSNTSALQGIQGVDSANTFYGLKQHPGIGAGFVSDYGSVMDAS